MSRICDVCGKGGLVGNHVSHANNKRKKRWQANIQRVNVKTTKGNKRLNVCTRCLRSGKVQKAV